MRVAPPGAGTAAGWRAPVAGSVKFGSGAAEIRHNVTELQ
jgi:hypothetical protein